MQFSRSQGTETTVTLLTLIALVGGTLAKPVNLLNRGRRRLRERDPKEKQRLESRRKFANVISSRIQELNASEAWSDSRFTELDAEVETVNNVPRKGLARLLGRQRGFRRERSLSNALIKSRERLVLLRGDPGSGKSVALRFVTQKMAAKAAKSKHNDAVIPLYINLKELRTEGRKIDALLIEDFVLENLRRGGERIVHKFLEAEFSSSEEAGGWLFLFDSFDEIPEVLSSTEDDEIVRAYFSAIGSFVEGMRDCRGVIASRHFRSPQEARLSAFRIMPLSERRKSELIELADIGSQKEHLVASLSNMSEELATLSSSPLFLGLLAEYVHDRGAMPEGWHDVFEAFVSRRLKTDRTRVEQHFHISSETLRRYAEDIAFTMTATDGFGLSPTRKDLKAAYLEAGFSAPADLDIALSALISIKLASSGGKEPKEDTFTFAHRRFQEYFATCVMLREPERISPRTVLTDGRWRETAVTLFQAQPQHTEPLMGEANAQLEEAMSANDDAGFSWRPGTLHLLSLLQSAFAGRAEGLPGELRGRVAAILNDAQRRGTITDRKWALEVAGTAPDEDMTALLLDAFRGRSDWLREVAYRQVARLAHIPANIAREIRRALIERAAHLELQRDWASIRVQLMRLRPPEPFVRTALLLRIAPVVDAAVFVGGFIVATMIFEPSLPVAVGWGVVLILGHLCYYRVADSIARFERSSPGSIDPREALRTTLNAAAVITRLGISIIPLVLSIGPELIGKYTLGLVPEGNVGPETVLPSAIWLYASSWSLVATETALNEAPRIVIWPLLPLLLLWREVRPAGIPDISRLSLRSRDYAFSFPSRESVITGIVTAIVFSVIILILGVGYLLYTWIPSVIPSTVGDVLKTALYVFLGLLIALLIIGWSVFLLMTWGEDLYNRRRWFGTERTSMTPSELLSGLATLHTTTNATWALREVRTRRLLHGDADAASTVRALLQLIERRPGQDNWPKSGTLAAWLKGDGKFQSTRLTGFGSEFQDELGSLLEELERGEEVPFA